MRRSADPAVDAHLGEQLLRDASYREEHAIVARRIERTLRPHAVWVAAAPEPELARIANIQHLATPIRAQLAEPLDALELAGLMHPTPAVGGEPLRARGAADPGARGPRPRLVPRAARLDRRRRRRRVLRGAALRAAERRRRALLRGRRHRPRLGARRGSSPRPRSSSRRCCRCSAVERRARPRPTCGGAARRCARARCGTSMMPEPARRRARSSAARKPEPRRDALVARARRARRRGRSPGRSASPRGGCRDLPPPGSRASRARDRQEVEDPAAVVVDEHDRQLQAEPRGGEQAADVVRERDVADQQHDRSRRAPAAAAPKARGDRSVDAVRAAVAEHPRRASSAGQNVSTSRTGIEEATNRVASPGSSTPSSAATAGSLRLSSPSTARATPRPRARRRRASSPSQPGVGGWRGPRQPAAARARAPARGVATDRRRGPARRPRGRARSARRRRGPASHVAQRL